ncbi:HAD-IC family P-type ATPase [bacterium]|nr:HAD-IC family P-type ATPase [bacterium]
MSESNSPSLEAKNDEHCIELDELYKRLKCSGEGLSSEEALKRQKEQGLNVLEEKKKRSVIIRFGSHLVNFFAILLWTGAILAFTSEYLAPGEGNLYIGIALAVVVILNAVFTFVQEYQSEQIMESFRKMMPSKINIIRNGNRQEILAQEIVTGDLLYLEEGNKIPADARLIEENSLKVDHSALTGESEPQLRKIVCTHDNILESRNMVVRADNSLSSDRW